MQQIEIHLAFSFDCDHCGRENFFRQTCLDPHSDQALEAREEMEIPDNIEGALIIEPEQVTCKHCNTTFDVEKYDPPSSFQGGN
ncbi:MAG: hypothetical protein JRD89_02185 [Deltaproteobacteria bacterium]|nr:hypothetical protein [Deltaproteobacteria bacterium]